MAKATTGEEERMWCGHCGVKTPIRREGNTGSVNSCNWCGKLLADETGTAEEYTKLFLRLQALQEQEQDYVSVSNKRTRRIKKQ